MDQDKYKLEGNPSPLKDKAGKTKYKTEEERRQANKERCKKYYEKNKQKLIEKSKDKYYLEKDSILEEKRKAFLIYKMYKEGKLVEK